MIALGCDHGGYAMKEAVKAYLEKTGRAYKDFGTDGTDSVDYALFAVKAAYAVQRGECESAVLVCSTGLGICMAANKVKGIRAATVTNAFSAEMTRRHNNANVLCLGGMIIDNDTAVACVEKFLTTAFEGGRHQRRVDEIAQIEEGTLQG